MQFKKISSMLEYPAWVLKKYNELKNLQDKNIYRIIDIKISPGGQYKIIAQIIGKSSIIECAPNEIVSNDQLLEGFSKKDVRTITYLAYEQIKKPKYKIIAQEFCEKFNTIIFKLKEINSERLLTKKANQIMIDQQMMGNLSKEDAATISYIAGYECSQHPLTIHE